MPPPVDRDILRLTIIVEIATRVRAEMDRITRTAFIVDRNQVDLAAYRLGSIGEYANKLSPDLKERHPQIEWRRMYDMRNALFHDYDGVVGELLWHAAGQTLLDLIEVCRTELARKAG